MYIVTTRISVSGVHDAETCDLLEPSQLQLKQWGKQRPMYSHCDISSVLGTYMGQLVNCILPQKNAVTSTFADIMALKVLVGCKRVIDYAVKIRVRPDNLGVG